MSSDPRNFFNCIVFSKLREAVQLGQAAIRGTPVARFHQGGGFQPGRPELNSSMCAFFLITSLITNP